MFQSNDFASIRRQFQAGLSGTAVDCAATNMLLATEKWPRALSWNDYILVLRDCAFTRTPDGVTSAVVPLRFNWAALRKDFGQWRTSGGDHLPWSCATEEENALFEVAVAVSRGGPLSPELLVTVISALADFSRGAEFEHPDDVTGVELRNELPGQLSLY